MKKYEILGLIPARGGSKGIPRKNIRILYGKPLIVYTIEEALKSRYLTKIVTSTDDKEIAKIAKESGTEVVIRPKKLATDESLVIDAVKHAISFVEDKEGLKFDYIILLQPTSPLRTAQDIDNAIEKMINLKADSVVSVTEVGDKHPARMKKIVNERIVDIFDKELDFVPRQKLPKIYIRNGAIYGAKREVIYKNNSFRGNDCVAYIMSAERSINIDTELDFKLAQLMIENVKNIGNRT